MSSVLAAVQNDGDRSVIYQFHLHHGAELSLFDLNTGAPAERQEVLVESAGLIRRRRTDERRTPAAPRIGQQRELRDDECLAADRLERQVHLALLVGEDSEPDNPVGDECRVLLAIVPRHSEQDDEAEPDSAHRAAVYSDLRPTYPLHNRSQRRLSASFTIIQAAGHFRRTRLVLRIRDIIY